MKEFIQDNFSEFILSLIILCTVVVLLFAIHWHDTATADWARSLIGGVVLALSATINTIKQPKPNGKVSVDTTASKD